MASVYWSVLVLLVGACIGSFLNVVIFRWPRNLSVRNPSRSFCPACEQPIAWYDNLPVLSYLRLGGRCRLCGCLISLQYPLVELGTAVVFLLVYDAFFVAHQRIGIGNANTDWPMLAAHWVLCGGLIALAVMDLEAYLVDIRVTWLVSAAGLVGHALWTPAGSRNWLRPGLPLAAVALAVVIGLAVAGWWTRGGLEEPAPIDEEPAEPAAGNDSSTAPQARPSPWSWVCVLLLAAGVLGYVVWMVKAGEQPPLRYHAPWAMQHMLGEREGSPPLDGGVWRLVAGFAAVFLGLALAASHPQPEADSEIVEVIHEEAPDARRNALSELGLLMPAIALAAAVALLIWLGGEAFPRVGERILHWRAVGDWQPVWGLSTAVAGWVVGGAIGWLSRIVFTLVFGKEALGMGDVHIMAAAGAVAGWPVVLCGFFLAAFLALLAVLLIRLRRQSRMLPYGPWLALAFVLTSVFQDRILLYADVRWWLETASPW